ncbi:iron-sulfur cluster assembly accessory protein [Candidatus Protofrankia californiensis]|uniref:iron-sulfur cluster assembly accessory protein n=1 Tax=Candidatus Protofrankia californiensis TaxID=1839754 RepID=UPI0013ECA65C|nr:iron-sulfur cluster assembly accessory protein [Candidatus Protofrankia californiensis]
MSIAISFTERAAGQVRALLNREGAAPASGLRVGVDTGGGCAGHRYRLTVESVPYDGDVVIRVEDLDVFVAASSVEQFDGMRIDYSESLMSSGFTFYNPHARSNCLCGPSFAPPVQPDGVETSLLQKANVAIQHIRPHLQLVGRDASVVGVADGVVSVRLTGIGLEREADVTELVKTVERQLKDAVPDVTRVVPASVGR